MKRRVSLLKQQEHVRKALPSNIAKQIKPKYGIAVKARRGYSLRGGEVGGAVFASNIVLNDKMSVAEAFQMIALSCVHHFAGNRAAVRNGDAEGIHQMRVGLRRLRAAISVFKVMLRGKEMEAFKIELKWLTAELGPARDMDVLAKNDLKSIGAQTEVKKSAVAALKTDICTQRALSFARAKAAVRSVRYRKLVLDTRFWLAGGQRTKTRVQPIAVPRKQRIIGFARLELHRRTRKTVTKLHKLDEMDAKHRHKARIAVKKLRYAVGYFETLFQRQKAEIKRMVFEKILADLQSSLGQLNDIRVHGEIADDYARATSNRKKKAPTAYAMGLLASAESSRTKTLLSEAMHGGKQLAEAKSFWVK